jgi:hypothetical protein
MEKRMEAVSVSTKDNLIWIEQSQNGQDNGVVVTPDQVPILIGWLQEAVKDLNPRAAF